MGQKSEREKMGVVGVEMSGRESQSAREMEIERKRWILRKSTRERDI